MKPENKHIDELLQQVLESAELDDTGIDWAAFQDRKKNKRRALVWWYVGAAIVVFTTGLFVLFNSRSIELNSNLQRSQTDIRTNSNSDLTKQATANKTPEQKVTQSEQPKTKSDVKAQETPNPLTSPKILHLKHYTRRILTSKRSDFPNNIKSIQPSDSTEQANKFASDKPFLLIDYEDIRQSRVNGIKTFAYNFSKTENIRRAQLKPKAHGKNLFEISASGFACNSIFRVMDLGKAFIHKDYENIRQSSERPIGGFDFRMSFGRIRGKAEFLIGFGYSNRTLQGQYDFIYSEKPLIDADGRIIGYDVNTPKRIQYTSRQSLTFVEVPLNFRYALKTNRKGHQMRLHLGFVPQFLKGIQGQLPNAQFLDFKETLSTENFRNTLLGGEIGLSYLLPLKTGMAIQVQPYYTYNSGFKQVNAYYKSSFQYFGLRAGLHIRL